MCVRLGFLLKYLSFIGATPHVVSQCTERIRGAHVPSCPSLRGPHVSATHFLQMQRRGSVCEVRPSPYIQSSYRCLIWIHTADTEWLMISWFFKRTRPVTTAAAAAAGWPHSLLQSSNSRKTTDLGGSEFIMNQQTSPFPYRPIFNISDRCLFSVSNQIVYFACFCPQLFKNISLTPSLTLIHHSTYRGHEEVWVWVFFLWLLFCDISRLIHHVSAFLCPDLQRCHNHIKLNNAGGLKQLQVCSHLLTSVILPDISILNLLSN